MTDDTEALETPARKPWLSFFIATAGGTGYIPRAPGTWGSILGVLIYAATRHLFGPTRYDLYIHASYYVVSFFAPVAIAIVLLLAFGGVAASDRVSHFTCVKDPQFVVIDEVSGQFLAYLLALAPLNWKYLLLGFILFRVFDIWKPFPARQAEFLRGGWGIMADDWVAGIYAALGLWIARGLGL